MLFTQADEDVLEEWKAMDATGNAKPGAVYAHEEDRYAYIEVCSCSHVRVQACMVGVCRRIGAAF